MLGGLRAIVAGGLGRGNVGWAESAVGVSSLVGNLGGVGLADSSFLPPLQSLVFLQGFVTGHGIASCAEGIAVAGASV